MIISVASGKGGTGKTTVATSLALSLNKGVQFLDCDVEEPNAHIFLKPHIEKSFPITIPVPKVDLSKCNFCGRCAEVCAYNAIAVIHPVRSNPSRVEDSSSSARTSNGVRDNVLVFPELCHGCGACSYLCPQGAIKEEGREIGVVEMGEREGINFVHGRLNIGEAMSPPLIRAVKECIDFKKNVIIDVPPGVSCPVIESLKNSDFCLLVTEPTPFGLNDLKLAVQTLKELRIPFAVIINRSDLGNQDVDDYCKKEDISILMRIPFKKEIAVGYSEGIPLIETEPEYREKFIGLYKSIEKRLK